MLSTMRRELRSLSRSASSARRRSVTSVTAPTNSKLPESSGGGMTHDMKVLDRAVGHQQSMLEIELRPARVTRDR